MAFGFFDAELRLRLLRLRSGPAGRSASAVAKNVTVAVYAFELAIFCELFCCSHLVCPMYLPSAAFLLAFIGTSASLAAYGADALAASPTVNPATRWGSCANVVAIPGNANNVNNAACAVCNGGKYPYYPCDTAGLCMCQGETVPPAYTGIFSSCQCRGDFGQPKRRHKR
jgi:hypothetical protein